MTYQTEDNKRQPDAAELRRAISDFQALHAEHQQAPISRAQIQQLAASGAKAIRENLDRTRTVLEQRRARDPNNPANRPKRDPLDHDGDGKKGGSLPKAKRVRANDAPGT